MKNNSDVEPKNRLSLRFVLGIIFCLLFVFSVDMILWAIGSLSSTINVIIVVLINLAFVFLVGVILWVSGIFNNNN